MLEHDLEKQALRFDPVVKTGFQKEPCLNKVIERGADSIRIDIALVAYVKFGVIVVNVRFIGTVYNIEDVEGISQ